ncbi:hypothetical protein SLS53_007089 [Cytospora paraplurivora]|uniref:P-loop containing nucleoside triphosphate hydrolase protein n=1 Tax=Cytospora paraplurivora TaxID=2898453 RepID=A0AAN9U3D9_9PEZI
MTRRDILKCAHEPFGDAFYYGPERLSERFADDEAARVKSGFSESTYRTIMNRLESDAKDGKRVFIKDIAHYLLPPNGKKASLAPSLVGDHTDGFVNGPTNGVPVEEDNPTVMPNDMLRGFHWTFLIRHPRKSIPSYFRCTIPPLDEVTGFHQFMPNEAGYDELRRLFDHLLNQGIIGPARAGETTPVDEALNGGESTGPSCSITVIDADDLLVSPEAILKVYCKEVGIDYKPSMLEWSDDGNQQHAQKAFEKWYGFHHDAIESTCLKPRAGHHATPTVEEENEQWRQKYGEEAAKVIRDTVDANIPHYEYLKSFAVKV